MKIFNNRNSEISSNTLLNKKNDKITFYRRFLLAYTAVFAFLMIVILSIFATNNASLIMEGDAFYQHYKALTYFAKYIREIIMVLLKEHRFVIPQWDFNVGMGSDIISTFSYYSFGDPFNFLSFLVPTKYMHIYYQAMLILRYYFAGISFSYLCFKTGNRQRLAVLTGSITYVFSAYALRAGLAHPYFINPLIILPLIILGVENIIKNKSPLLFMAMVGIAAFTNFYFFYMIVLLTIIYVIVRFITYFKTDIKSYLLPFLKIAYSSVVGVLMGAVLFLPTVFAFLGDFRSSVERVLELFYEDVYGEMFVSFFAYSVPTTWLIACLSIFFLPCLIMLFTKKKSNIHLKIFYIISLIFMIFPIFGKIFNGFSYVNNRWVFAYVLLMSFVIVKIWNDLINADKKQITIVTSVSVIVMIVALCLGGEKSSQMVIPFLLLLATLIVFILFGRNKFDLLYLSKDKTLNLNKTVLQLSCLALTVLSVINYSYHMLSSDSGDLVSDFVKSETFDNLSYTSNKKIRAMTKGDKDFWRCAGRYLSVNASFIDGLNSTQYQWSLSNGNISKFRYDMNMAENLLYFYQGFDDRSALNALASVKYFYNSLKDNDALPYGYNKISATVSQNSLALPLGYTYSDYITQEAYDNLADTVKKQEMMLNAAMVETKIDSLNTTDFKTTSSELDYKINLPTDSVTQDGNTFVVDKAKSQIELLFEAVPDSETYLCLSDVGVNFEGSQNAKITFDLLSTDTDGNEYAKYFYYYSPEANFYSGRENFDINLGYTESGICKLKITFPYQGTYSFSDIKLISQPMSNFSNSIDKLKQDVLENVEIDYNTVSGTIDLDKTKLLCLSIPYSGGWSAEVDGEKAELLKTNGMYMGLVLDEGEHEIELTYRTPGLKAGILLSFVGICIFTATAVYYKKRKKAE